MKLEEIKLGQPVIFSKVLYRKELQHPEKRYKRIKKWLEKPVKEQSGIIIGKRTLSNGETEWEEEVGNIYEGKEYFQALLIATSLSAKPVFIPMLENGIVSPEKVNEA
jgi:hypothetical protein